MPRVSLRSAMLCILLTVLALASVDIEAAGARSSARAAFISDTNHARDNHARRDYRVRDSLMDVAQRWANWMAAHHTLRHNPYLSSQVRNWQSLGENVGMGGSESAIQRAFMNSYSHRDNILSRQFRQVGIGTARSSDGRLYVDEVFREPRS